MSNETQNENVPSSLPAIIVRHELHHVRAQWCWFLFLGILMLAAGAVAVTFPFIASEVAIHALSIILLVAGVATLVGAFWTGRWEGFLVQVLVGMLYLAGGFIISEQPLVSIMFATIYIAVSFMVMGIFRIVAALTIRFPQWGWTLLNGAITFVVGLSIFRHLPIDAVWVVGLLIGVELVFCGWTWIMLALAIRRIPK